MGSGAYQRCKESGCRKKAARYDRCPNHAATYVEKVLFGLSPEFGKVIVDYVEMTVSKMVGAEVEAWAERTFGFESDAG